MSKVILKDKKDLNTLKSRGWSKDGYEIVGSQDEITRDIDVEVVSVKFSKIGQKTFDAYPNLKWIVCRSHGYDNVNEGLAKKYNVGVLCTNPNTLQVAEWIIDRGVGHKVLVLGAGRIGKKFAELHKGESTLVNSKTKYDSAKGFDTIVITSAPTETSLLTKETLQGFTGNVISISRPCCVDNQTLLDAIKDGNVSRADMDMLDSKGREELLETGKCFYYGHIAWGGATSYTHEYFDDLFYQIDTCLVSLPPNQNTNIVLQRNKNVFEL